VKILVADDDLVNLTAIRIVLRAAGHEVVTVTDGMEAWNRLRQPDAPQIAVLDWMMPGMDGVEICRRLRKETPRPNIYVLLLTARSDPQDVIEGLEAGANDFLHKPFVPAELRARLEAGQRSLLVYNELAQTLLELRNVLQERERVEVRLRHSESRLRMVMDTVPAGVLVCDDCTGQIVDSNPVARQSLAMTPAELNRRTYHGFFQGIEGETLPILPPGHAGADCRLVAARGRTSHIRLTQATVRFDDRDLRLFSFLDVSDTRRLLDEQQLSLAQARKLLTIANAGVPRWIGVNDDLTLHASHYSASSQRAGGDHCWARTVRRGDNGSPVTLIGLRDQSGHEVNCILRSIATDLFYNEALERGLGLEGQLAFLNDRICTSGMFAADDFLTGMTLELNHANLRLRYVSNGHPPILLIRGTGVLALPGENDAGQNLPLGSVAGLAFEAGEFQLRAGDRLLLFTDGLLELGRSQRGTVLSAADLRGLVKGLVEKCPDIPVRQLVSQLIEAANPGARDRPTTPPPDDVTILGLELEPDAGLQGLEFHPAGLPDLDQIIRQTSERLLSEWKIEEGPTRRIRLFLDEAVSNAWSHGNRENPALPIHVRWGQRNGYSLMVEDAGTGFNPAQVPDPCSADALLQENGRGVHLIQNSCEWSQWKRSGTRLVARFASAL
jgi:DNA-binding response OmpR family regulator/anti-sigma regulatory factor (Ser/Thr protein kinase)